MACPLCGSRDRVVEIGGNFDDMKALVSTNEKRDSYLNFPLTKSSDP